MRHEVQTRQLMDQQFAQLADLRRKLSENTKIQLEKFGATWGTTIIDEKNGISAKVVYAPIEAVEATVQLLQTDAIFVTKRFDNGSTVALIVH